MTDYARLIDPETWSFIRATERWYPPETASFGIAQQREVYDRMCAAFRQPRPEGLDVTDTSWGGVPCRCYDPPRPEATVLYFHGGGFVVGGLDSHDDVCAEIAARTGLRVISADYRLAPEHPHPAAFDDAVAATLAVGAACPGPLVLAGDSAGGNLAAAAAHALRGRMRPLAGVVLIYPALGGDRNSGSMVAHAQAPMLTRADLEFYDRIRRPTAREVPDDPTFAPLRDPDLTGLPPTIAFAAECDPLCDDATAYAERLRAAGGRARAVTEPGLVHGYLRARHSVARARDSFTRIVDSIDALARGRWPDPA
ncbi:alpha/beta hydrolase fold domain-containing protein [Rubellimicrobium arenae]|uniref:alpha/beta hydrolase fold domain-containing protein n=1 Tax=Rubellimicrobium arenae TaxID=2817372 RepID=UPI001B306B9B|nr:alpha/beta hydrolase fold domain-containing protein [Rubellimicrobium arenae]